MTGNSAKRPKRTTPPNEGYDYEVLIAILIAATFSKNKQVENYYIFPGLSEAYPFDDIVVKVLFKGKNTPYAFAIQLKHKGKGETLDTEKYLKGYHKISDIGGLETIGNIALENIHLSYLCIKRVAPEARYDLISHNSISDSWKAAFPFQNCYRLSYNNSTNEADDEKLKDFLNNFYLCLYQPDTKKLKENIRILCKISDTTDILRYVEGFFKNDILWARGLSKEIFETELLKIRLLDYILLPADITPLQDSSSQAWNELTLKYNVTIVEDEHNIKKHLYGCLAKMLGCLLKNTIDWKKCVKNDLDDSVINEFKKLCEPRRVKHWIVLPKTLKLLIIELWKYGEIPLILESDADLSFLKSYAHLNKRCIIITTSLVNQMTLLCASKWGQTNLVKLLLEKGTDVNSIITDDKTLLMFASEFCGLDTVKLLLSKGAKVNSKTATGKTPLMFASERGHIEVVELLLKEGGKINSMTTNGKTPFIFACEKGNSDIVELLIDKGARFNHKTATAKTPLMFASNLDVVKLLIKKRAKVNSATTDGKTPLMFASERGNADIVKLLLENRANVNSATIDGITPLMFASDRGNLSVVKLLIENGGKINSMTVDGKTSLIFAIEKKNVDVINLLIEKGAHVNAYIEENGLLISAIRQNNLDILQLLLNEGTNVNSATMTGKTLLMFASEGRNPDVVNFLLTKGADTKSRTIAGETSLMLASKKSNIGVVELLIKKGTKINSKSTAGKTPLMFAAERGNAGIVKLLLKERAKINNKTAAGKTSLMYASEWDNLAVAELLIEKRATINSVTRDGKTPLMFASDRGNLSVVKLLIEKGGKVNSKTVDGKTPLMFACDRGNLGVVEFLLQTGANINHTTTQGKTALMFASESGNSQIVKLLLKKKPINSTITPLARTNNLVTHREEIPLSVFTHASDIEYHKILGDNLLKGISISLHGRKPISLYDIVNWHEDLAMTLSCSQILHLMKRREAYLSKDCLRCNHNIVFLIEDQSSSTEYDIDDILNNIDGNTTIRCRSSEKIRGYREQIKNNPQLQDYETYHCVKLPENKNITLLKGKKSLLRDYFVDQDEERVYYPDFCTPIPILGNNLRSIQEDYIPRFLCTAIISKSLFDSNTKGICFCSGDFAGSEISNGLINVSVEEICFNNENSFINVNGKNVDEYWKNASNLDCPLLHIHIEGTEMHLYKSKKWQGLTNHILYSSQSISEEQLLQKITKRITIITGESGIGKSRLLRSLFENYGTDNYILLYNLADYEKDKNEILSANSSLDFIFNKLNRGTRYSKFLSGVLKNTERLLVLLDSFDKVMSNCKEKILEFIRNLAASNVKIIIASRLIANCVLMDNFEVQIFRIDLLRADDRRKCIKNCNLSEADLTTIPIVFTGNPMYCNFLKIISKTNVTLAHVSKLTLFKRIMCIKLDQYFESNFSSDLDKEYCLRRVREIHAKLALVKILGADVVKTLLTWKYEEKLYHNLKLGVVLSIDEGCLTFVDKAFAEYLTADWITVNIKESSAKDIYREILKQNKHCVLDILCEHLKLHRAIIDKNLEQIKKYTKESLHFEEFDDLGRTALHVAAARFNYSSSVWYYSPIGILTHNMYNLKIDFTTCDNLMQWNWIQHLNNGDEIHLMPCYDLSTSVMEVYVNDIVKKLGEGVFGLHSDNNLTNRIRNVYEKAIEACCIDLIRNLFLLDYTRSSGVPEGDILNLKGCSLRGFTALHAACIFNNLEAVRKLLNMSYDINIGATALIFDFEENNSDIVNTLFEANADVDSTTEHGETALMFAVKFGNSSIVKILLENSANVNSKTVVGKTPLMFASETGNSDIVNTLFEANPDVDSTTEHGETALMFAAQFGNSNIVEILLEKGANVSSKTAAGKTPRMFASEKGYSDIVKILEGGAHVTAQL